MILGISQPTFMPWIGYFAFLDKLDKIIFLDDIQFEKRSWQQRNCIKINGDKHFLTVSVKSKHKFHQNLSEVEIFDYKNLEVIKKKIFYGYKKSKYFQKYYEKICNIIDKKHIYLIDLNIELIKFFLKELNIKLDFNFSSKYSLSFKKEKLIFELCKLNNCSNYLSTLGSMNYLDSFSVIPNTKIKISYFEYKDIRYQQLSENFIPKLSIIDLLFNEGDKSLDIIRNGFRLI
tara:strand:+ start:427 stop:1122 length:696 start_codon:yes stop_codon:yes gene_type:complete